MSDMIENILIQCSHLYIFGAGSTALKVKKVLQDKGKIICSFIVSSALSDQQIEGIQITPLTDYSEFDTNLPVIVAVFNREPNAFLPEIIIKLKALGFSKIITYPEFESFFPEQLHDNYWLTDKKFYNENIQEFIDVLSLFNDPVSINNYSLIIEYIKTFDPLLLKYPDFEDQYFPKDINVWNGEGAFYDLGSYDGSNILDAFREKGLLELVVAFEPDLNNFQKIINNSLLQNSAKQLFLYPCGVWSETTFLKFSAGTGESSFYNESGRQLISVVKIDDVLHAKPGYIKLDVEGAEINALLGAKNTICKHKPSLAISIYHHPDHFYSIPKLVSSWNLGYKFYVRMHGNNLFDTVLYCIQ
jgi:FkbM family methyltransferase